MGTNAHFALEKENPPSGPDVSAPEDSRMEMLHSQRKKRTARTVQSTVTPSITPIGSRTLPVRMPKADA